MVDGLSPQAHTPRTSAPPVLSRLVVGRHISTDGGLIRAAKFLVEPLRNGELQGASLNIIVTKKSVDGGLSETPRMYAKQLRSRDAQNQDKRFLIKQLLKMDMDEYRVRIFRRMTAGLGDDLDDQAASSQTGSSCTRCIPPTSQAPTRRSPLYDCGMHTDISRVLVERSKTSLIREMRKAQQWGSRLWCSSESIHITLRESTPSLTNRYVASDPIMRKRIGYWRSGGRRKLRRKSRNKRQTRSARS